MMHVHVQHSVYLLPIGGTASPVSRPACCAVPQSSFRPLPHKKSFHHSYRTALLLPGLILLGAMLIGIMYCIPWPRQTSWLKNTWLGIHLNNFNYFWLTHHLMLITFVVCLFLHPPPNFWLQFPRTLAPLALPQVCRGRCLALMTAVPCLLR